MPGLFGIVNIGLSALLSHRDALNVRAQNMANVDTPGYSRQEAMLGTNPSLPPAGTAEAIIGGQYGTGVRLIGIYRAREGLLGIQARICQSSLGRHQMTSSALRQVESVLAPGPGEDLNAALDAFWDAWESVANKPEDLGLRYVLQATAGSLSDTFRGYVERLNSIRISLDQGIKSRVEEVNNLTKQIAEFNRQISVAQAEGRAPNDLLDSRDILLDQLAALTGAMPANSEAGDLIVYLDGRPLVQGGASWELSINAGVGGIEIRSSYNNAEVAVEKGEIGGLLYARDTAIPAYLAELEALAGALVSQVNAAHQTGFGLDGVSGRDFFIAGSTAGDIRLDTVVLNDINAIAAGLTNAPGDGVVALNIANLRTTPVMGGRTLNEVSQALIGMIGKEVYAAEDGITAQEFAREQIRQQQQSIAGVSIDEEITYLIMSQRAYEAAARIITAADDMMRIIIERLGV